MTSVTGNSTIPDWESPPGTAYELDYAQLTKIDLSNFDKPGGKQQLAEVLKDALNKDGFWAVVGSGIGKREVEIQLALAQAFFNQPLEEKTALECDFPNGNYFGYKRLNRRPVFGTSVLENSELINIPKFATHQEEYVNKHSFIRQHRAKIEDFSRKAFEVARKLFVLFAIVLELEDEKYFVERHLYEDPSDDHLRYMKYHPRSVEDDQLVENIWARAHTDFGSLTLLWSQVVRGLQLKTRTGEWKYIPPVDDGIICNIGDTLSFWSNGYFKSTVHRVVRPPPDQADRPRIGLFYFVRPGQAAIETAPSPLLQRLGLDQKHNPVTGTEYVRQRVKNYHDNASYEKRAGERFRVGDYEIDDGFN